MVDVCRFGHKGILHPAAATPDRPSPLTEMGLSVPVPRGWYCTCNAEIMFALKRLREDGVGRVVIKPVFGAAGEGIVFPTSDEQINDYHFPMGPVNLEEYLVSI